MLRRTLRDNGQEPGGLFRAIKKRATDFVDKKKYLYNHWGHSFMPRPPVQPFGPEFGLTIYPSYMRLQETFDIKSAVKQVVDSHQSKITARDGRLEFPPLSSEVVASVLRRAEEDRIVPAGYLNNHTTNVYKTGDFFRAHIDNTFIYDNIILVASVGAPCYMEFTHMQTGHSMEVIFPRESIMVIEGPARYVYMHSVLPVENERATIVLRRSILPTVGKIGLVSPPMDVVLPYRGNNYFKKLMSCGVGVAHIDSSDKTTRKRPTGIPVGMVDEIKPLREWSLLMQLEEDEARVKEMYKAKRIDHDFEWRFLELKKVFTELELHFAGHKAPDASGAESDSQMHEVHETKKEKSS